jgi:hypothetical protein
MRVLVLLLGLAKYAVLIGLIVLGLALWSTLRASTGGGLPKLKELRPVGGLVMGGREVTVERKHRKSGTTTTQKFFELDLQTEAGGTPTKLRVDHTIGRERLEPLMNRRIAVHYDPSDVNMVFVLQAGGSDVIPYAEMAALQQERADTTKAADGSARSWMGGLLLIVLGAAGVAWRRRLAADLLPA